MAVSYICGFEMDAISESAVNSASSILTSPVHTGGFSGQIVSTAGGTKRAGFDSRASGGTERAIFQSARFYFQAVSLPTTNGAIVRIGASSILGFDLVLNTDGTLSLRDNPTSTIRATSTNALSADAKWHRIDYDCGWSAGAGTRVFVDGVQWASESVTTVAAQTFAGFGVVEASAAITTYDFDDIVLYDSALPATLGDYRVSLLAATSDNARGGWTDGAGGTTSLFDSLNNIPPTGAAASTNGTKIKNAVSSTTDNYDANCAPYNSIAGLTSSSQLLAVQAICNDAQEVTTGSPKAGAVVIASNPSGQTEQSFDFGLNSTNSAVAVGTFPTGWGTHLGPVTENPSVTVSSGPVARVGKRVATTRVVDVDFLGVYVMWAQQSLVFSDRPIRRNSLLRR